MLGSCPCGLAHWDEGPAGRQRTGLHLPARAVHVPGGLDPALARAVPRAGAAFEEALPSCHHVTWRAAQVINQAENILFIGPQRIDCDLLMI